MSELRFDRVSVRYGTHRVGLTAVDDVSLVVPSGSVVGLVGESGSGKSTLARAAIGLAPISEGAITLDGVDVRSFRRRRPLQMVFQDPFSSPALGDCGLVASAASVLDVRSWPTSCVSDTDSNTRRSRRP